MCTSFELASINSTTSSYMQKNQVRNVTGTEQQKDIVIGWNCEKLHTIIKINYNYIYIATCWYLSHQLSYNIAGSTQLCIILLYNHTQLASYMHHIATRKHAYMQPLQKLQLSQLANMISSVCRQFYFKPTWLYSQLLIIVAS